MYLDEARSRIKDRSFPDAEDIHPCTAAEVEALERKLGQPLPGAVREFLLWCGHGLGDLWSGNRCFEYEELIERAGLDAARRTLVEAGFDASVLDDPVLVFQFDECDQFAFVRLDEGDDPPVYGRNEGQSVERHCDHFSGYVKLIVDQEFGLEEGGQEVEEGVIRSSGPTADTAAPEFRSIVPPELQPDRDWVEESYGFLPPSVQERLGELRASFKPSAANLFAGVVFGVLFILGGLTLMGLGFREVALEHFELPWLAQGGMSWLMFGLIEVASAGMCLGGVLLIRHVLRLSRARVFVGEGGICCSRDSRHELMLWTEMRGIEEVVIRDRAPINTRFTWLIPFGKSRRYVLHSQDGLELAFDSNNVRSFARFEAILRCAASVHHLPWSVTQV
jgi:hypothetical protein